MPESHREKTWTRRRVLGVARAATVPDGTSAAPSAAPAGDVVGKVTAGHQGWFAAKDDDTHPVSAACAEGIDWFASQDCHVIGCGPGFARQRRVGKAVRMPSAGKPGVAASVRQPGGSGSPASTAVRERRCGWARPEVQK